MRRFAAGQFNSPHRSEMVLMIIEAHARRRFIDALDRNEVVAFFPPFTTASPDLPRIDILLNFYELHITAIDRDQDQPHPIFLPAASPLLPPMHIEGVISPACPASLSLNLCFQPYPPATVATVATL
jgi:hypothetical protein